MTNKLRDDKHTPAKRARAAELNDRCGLLLLYNEESGRYGLRTMNGDWGGSRGATFSKGPDYTFPTKTTMHKELAPPPQAVAGVEYEAGRNVSLIQEVLPELSAAEAAAALRAHGGSVRGALAALLGAGAEGAQLSKL